MSAKPEEPAIPIPRSPPFGESTRPSKPLTILLSTTALPPRLPSTGPRPCPHTLIEPTRTSTLGPSAQPPKETLPKQGSERTIEDPNVTPPLHISAHLCHQGHVQNLGEGAHSAGLHADLLHCGPANPRRETSVARQGRWPLSTLSMLTSVRGASRSARMQRCPVPCQQRSYSKRREGAVGQTHGGFHVISKQAEQRAGLDRILCAVGATDAIAPAAMPLRTHGAPSHNGRARNAR